MPCSSENVPKKVNVSDIWKNEKKSPEPERKGLEYGAEEDTLMGRLAKRMASRDMIDTMQIGTKKREPRAPSVAVSEDGMPKKMRL